MGIIVTSTCWIPIVYDWLLVQCPRGVHIVIKNTNASSVFWRKKTSVLINNFTVFLIDKRRNSDQNDVSVRLRSVTSITYRGIRHPTMHVTLQSFHSKFQWFALNNANSIILELLSINLKFPKIKSDEGDRSRVCGLQAFLWERELSQWRRTILDCCY